MPWQFVYPGSNHMKMKLFLLIVLALVGFSVVNAQDESVLNFDSLRYLDAYYRGEYDDTVLPMTILQQIGWGRFSGAAWFPDSERFALSTTEGIWFYDSQDPTLSPTLFHEQGGSRLAISNDGKLLGAWYNSSIMIWDIETAEMVRTFEYGWQFAFNPDSSQVAVATSRAITIYDISTGELLLQHSYPDSPGSFSNIFYWDANSLLLVIDNYCCGAGPIDLKIMDIESGEMIPVYEGVGINNFLLKNPETQMLYLYSDYTFAKQFNMATQPPTLVEPDDHPFFQYHNETVWDFSGSWISPNQAYVLRMDVPAARFEVMELATRNVVTQGEYAYVSVPMITLTPDGAGFATVIQANRIGIWNFEQGDWSHFLDGHTDTITDMFFTSDTTLYSASEDGTVRVWNLATDDSTVLVDLPKYRISGILPGVENEILVSRCLRSYNTIDGGIMRLDIHTGEPFTVEGLPPSVIEETLMNPDACYDFLMSGFRRVMFGDQHNLYIPPGVSQRGIEVIPLPQLTATDDLTMRWVASGDGLLSFGDTGVVMRWEKPEVDFKTDGSLRYRWSSGTILAVHENPVTAAAAYSPTMTFSAACSHYDQDRSPGGPYETCAGADFIRTDYEAQLPSQVRQPLTGHTAPIRAMVVHPNGKILITASEDGTILIWGIKEPGG